MNYLKSFATVHPVDGINEDRLGKCQSLLAGRWIDDVNYFDDILDPITGKPFLDVPKTEDISGFISQSRSMSKKWFTQPTKE